MRTSLFLLALMFSLLARSASAHQFDHPRQIRLGFTKDQLVVSMIFDLDPGERSRTARQLFDRNTDGVIDAAERELLEAWMERTALRSFSITLLPEDGPPRPIQLERRQRDGHRTDLPSGASESLGLSLLLSAPLPPSSRTWRFVVRDQEVDVTKHVPLTLDLAPTLYLRFASQGEWHPKTRQLHRVMLGKERPLCLHLRRGGPPKESASSSFSGCLA